MSPDFGWQGDVAEVEESDPEDEEELKEPEPWEVTDDTEELKEMWLEADGDDRTAIRDRLHELGHAPPEGEESEQSDLVEAADGGESEEESEEDASPEPEPETADGAVQGETSESGGEDPFADLAGDSLSPEEAEKREHQKRVLIWGPPNVGKTHSAFTADEPIAILDTEGKAHDLSEKFEDTTYRIWQPGDYAEASEYLEQAMDWLGAWLEERDERGTLVVDSMSIMWEWAKQHYVSKYYPMRDSGDVDLKSGIGTSGDSDWKKIKEYHNTHFRQKMVQSPFHLVWTAMATEDFAEMMERSLNTAPDKPAGEKENPYKVNYILHVREGSGGVPTGDLEKSGVTQHTFSGLEWPTLPKMFSVVDDLKEAETGGGDLASVSSTHDVELIKGKPSRLRGVEEEDDG